MNYILFIVFQCFVFFELDTENIESEDVLLQYIIDNYFFVI